MKLPFKFSAASFAGALLISISPVSAQQVTTFAGNGSATFSGDGGPAAQAALNSPDYVATDLAGNVYIADQSNNRVRKVDSKGIITTVAGTGAAGFSGDGGPAVQAALNYVTGVCTDAAGNLYIDDLTNARVRKVDTSGIITTVAGNGVQASTGDGGPATKASMYLPIRCAVDSLGNLFIADQAGHKIRKVDTSGTITTFAGTGNHQGIGSPADFSGDGGPAIAADLNNPTAIAFDASGALYFSDQFNQRIRKVDKNSIITTVAGTGTPTFSGDGGPATSAAVNYPGSIVFDQNGDMYFGDPGNNRIRKISNGIISTVAGTGGTGFLDGPANAAVFNNSFGLAMDAAGNLYVADINNNRIRKLSGATATVPPNFTAASVTNGASFKSGLAPGALITIFGANLSNGVRGNAAFSTVPLPTTLGGSRVLIAGTPIPLFNVINIQGTEQINAQVPFELASQQSFNILIDNGRGISTPVQVAVAATQPGIFLEDGIVGAFLHGADNSVVTGSKPASAGEVVVVYCTGLGAVTPPGATGALASSTTLSNTNIAPTVTVGGVSANIAFSGLAPALVGLYQINFTVPQSTPSGSIDVVVTANGVASNTAKLPVK
jgi:uncharacterized protein (TIGR03437 family)